MPVSLPLVQRVPHGPSRLVSLALIALACLVACSAPEEVRTEVHLRAFDSDGAPLARARILFRDAGGERVGAGELVHGNGFRFESGEVPEDGDWGRRVRTADVETDTCSSSDDPIALLEESRRIAVGGHPSLRSKRITRYELRATVVCLRALSAERRRAYERGLREGDLRSRIRAAVELGWIRAPEGAGEELQQAMRDASAIALGIVHSPKPDALLGLVAALDDEREPVRLTAAVLLARLGRNEGGIARAALPALEERSNDPSELVRLLAGHAIDRIAPR